MRNLIGSVLAVVFLSVLMAAGGARADFLGGTEDVPLMAGLTETPDSLLVFDTPSGRIVEVTADGVSSAATVRDFYADTLPQLGWSAAGDAAWRRADEVLRLEFPAPGTVRFVVAPADTARR